MLTHKKKIAPRAATPETKNRKILSINSIIKNSEDVKVMLKRPGEIPRVVSAYDIPKEFLSKKLRCETLGARFSLIYDTHSCDDMNIAVDKTIIRGMVLIVNRGFDGLREMSPRDYNDAFVWLMNHRI